MVTRVVILSNTNFERTKHRKYIKIIKFVHIVTFIYMKQEIGGKVPLRSVTVQI